VEETVVGFEGHLGHHLGLDEDRLDELGYA